MIRRATESDFESILNLSEKFWESTIYSEPFDRDHAMVMVKLSFDLGLLAVIDTGQVVGFCAAIMAPILGSPCAYGATELAWYVSPESRGGKNGVKLMQFMEEIAKEAGVKYFTMISMHSSMDVGSIYERLGYTKTETSYTKVI